MFSLGPHCIGVPASLPEFMTQSGCTIVKYLDPPSNLNLPKAEITIGRVHWLSEDKDLSDPIWTAKLHADELSARTDVTGIRLWEGINESPVWIGDDYIRRLVVYELERVRILNNRGIGAVVLNLSRGWPLEIDSEIIWEPFRELLKDLPEGNYLGLHEYWNKDGPLAPDSLYHLAGRLFRCPFDVPILVTECGVDYSGGQNDGWRGQGLSVEQYVSQLAQYRDLLAGDPRVKGATIFTYGTVGQWQSFDIEPNWFQFAPICQPVSAEVEVRNPIRVLYRGEVLILELETYLESVVGAEMPALWSMNAIKAQAIASRSYAMWRCENPRSDTFDIYADARDQVYNPAMIHERTERAIKETKGIYLLKGDKVYVSHYVSRCGRDDCALCNGTGGFDDKAWKDRMCQYGSRAMGDAGSSYREILRHYYGDVQFSDEGGTVPNPKEIIIDKYPTPGTILGLHWTPKRFHAVADLRPFMDRAKEAGVGWMMLIDDGGGSVLQPSEFYGGRSIVDEMRDRNFEIILRMFAGPHAKFDARMEDAARRLVEKGVHYIFWQNEPECEKWYADESNPPTNWVEIVFRNWVEGAYKMKALGAYPGTPALTTFHTPDPAGNIVNPFLTYMTEQERYDLFITWYAWVNRHIYPIHHPIHYPYDAVNQAGMRLTHEDYLAAIAEVSQAYRERTGEYWVWETWEHNEYHINMQRDKGKQPGCTLLDDDVCWLSYTGTVAQLQEAGIDKHTIILSTETGPCIGDKGKDGRYPRVTLQAQIRMIDRMLAEAEPPLVGLCFWLAGCRDLAATESNFERQSWWTHEWNEVFELDGEIPLVQHLIDNPGGGELPPPEPIELPEEPPMSEPECNNDAIAYGVTVEPAIVPGGVLYWKCIRVHHLEQHENNGNHNIFVNVYDEWGLRVNPNEAQVTIWWQDGQDFIPLDKPDNEPMGNAPLWKGQVVGVQVGSELDSDRVVNIHTNHDDEPPGNTRFHHSFLVEFQLVIKALPPEPPVSSIDSGCNLVLVAIARLIESLRR